MASISKSDVLQWGIIQHPQSRLWSVICTISAVFPNLLIFHLTQLVWTYHHKLALWCGISLANTYVFNSVWEVTLIWAHIYLLFMLICVLKSSFFHKKDKEWKISIRAQGRVERCLLCIITAGCLNFWRHIHSIQINLFLNIIKQFS